MSYTKRQLIEAAFTEIGLAPYAFEQSVDQLEAALVRLDSMLAEWNARGLRLGYNTPNVPGVSTLDSDSGLPDRAWEAVITNLAMHLAPSYGKTLSIDTRIAARHSLNTILVTAAMPSEMELSSIPAGAGYKYAGNNALRRSKDTLVAGPDATIGLT